MEINSREQLTFSVRCSPNVSDVHGNAARSLCAALSRALSSVGPDPCPCLTPFIEVTEVVVNPIPGHTQLKVMSHWLLLRSI